jgi:hypothetical protein
MRILPPSYRFPPRAGRTKQRFPLRSRGNLTEGVFKKCRAISLIKGGRECCESPLTPTLSPLEKGGESAVNPPLTPTLSPLEKGGEGEGSGGI